VAYPDVDAMLVAWLPTVGIVAGRFTDDDVLPSNLAYDLPVVQVVTYGGTEPTLTIDESYVDVDVYAASRSQAKALAEQIRAAIMTRLICTVGGVPVAKRRLVQRPSLRPYDNTAIRRIGATYAITCHASP
jgi:hypothetical protein